MIKKIILLLLGISITGAIIYMKYNHTSLPNKAGTVIILNGPSASGKSSIQTALQSLVMPELWIKLGIDTLFDKPMPDITLENLSFWQKPNPIRWVETTTDIDNNQVITLFTGKQGECVAYGMNSAIAAYAQAGCNVIVDYIAYNPLWIADLQKKLHGIKTHWVKIEIPLEVLEMREAARGTSPKGHARSHYATVYGDIQYDLVVNSAEKSALEIAHVIKTTFNI